jgi:putative addiction module component (TIGR02574 family)
MAATSLSELLNLPPGERADLAVALWESLSDEQREEGLPLGPEQAAELDRRWAAHVANPVSVTPV